MQHERNTRRVQVKNIFAETKLISELVYLTFTVLFIIVGNIFRSRTSVN